MIRLIAFLSVGLALISCSGSTPTDSTDQGSGPVYLAAKVPQPNPDTKLAYISISTSPFIRNGQVTRLDVEFSPFGNHRIRPSRRTPIVAIGSDHAARVAASFRTGQDASAAYEAAVKVARATYCRAGPIAPNEGIVRYTRPEDIAAIVAESSRLRTDAVPEGIEGEPIPSTWFRTDGTPRWQVSLHCNAPTPYR